MDMLTLVEFWFKLVLSSSLDKWPKTASGYTSTAGTTASVAFIKNGKLYTGHVGDSAIVLGEWEKRNSGESI